MKLPKAKKLPSGAWNVQVMVDGKRVSITAPTEKEAVAKAAQIKADGKIAARREKKLTLREAIDEYIALKGRVLSPSTIRGYRTTQRNRFQKIMDTDIHRLDKQTIQREVTREAGLCAAKTVANAYGLIRPVLKEYGIDVFGVRLPQIVKQQKQYLQPEDIGKLIQVLDGDSCEVPILLAVWLGMRRSEIIGLCWDCVDLENGVIHIRRAVVPDEHNVMVLKETTKNRMSQRSIKCPEYIMEKMKTLPPGTGQIFRMSPDTLLKHVHKACERAGITDTTCHGLRHTNAAVMKTIGVDDRHAMARGGWSTESTYRATYSYVFDNDATEADLAIDQYFADKIADKKE